MKLRMDKIGTGTLAVEVSADRGHSAIVAACRVGDDSVRVELVAYLTGTASAPDRVVEFCSRWTVHGVAIDPMGGATNMRRLLEGQPGVHLVTPDAAAVRVAHADFLDSAHSRRLTIVENEFITRAMQYLTERQLGGQPVFDRRGAPVDVAPAVAAELALWALENAPLPPQPFALWGS
jgi:hypothetical protein